MTPLPSSWWLVLSLAAAVGPRVADAQATSPLVLELRGATDSFGPGPMVLWEDKVEFRLTRDAHVVLLWIGREGQVDLYWPLRSGDRSARRAGRHAISVGDVKSPIEPPTIAGTPSGGPPGQFAPTRSAAIAGRPDTLGVVGYWALLVSDAPITPAEVRARLQPMSREGGGLAILERLPEVLLVGRAGLWAAYFAPVAR
jgi:hypothetical protein